MKIEKYIEALLFDHECVIIPGLGGFIVNERHASIDHLSHQFHPPYKKILFNQHIRFNDGLLINYISSKENLTFEFVRKQIDDLVHQYFAQLESGEKIKFENIGVIAFDQNKNISFDQDTSVNFNAESFGLGTFVSPPIKRKKETEPVKGIVQAPPVIQKREDRKPEQEVAEELKPIHERKNKPKALRKSTFAVITIIIFLASSALLYINWEPAQKSVQNLTASLNFNKEKSRYTPRPDEKNKIDILIPNQAGFLSGTSFEMEKPESEAIAESSPAEIQAEKKFIAGEISVANYFNYRGRNLNVEVKEPEVVEENLAEESNEMESADIPEPKEIIKEETVVKLNPTSQYYIIAGSFSEEKNAHSLIDELLKKGFSAQIIDTNRNGMYRVAYIGFATLNEAKQQLYAIREENNPEAWILKK